VIRERDHRLMAAVDDLPDLYRTIVLLYYWHDLPLAEIAAITGVAPGTLKSYLGRARELLRRRLS